MKNILTFLLLFFVISSGFSQSFKRKYLGFQWMYLQKNDKWQDANYKNTEHYHFIYAAPEVGYFFSEKISLGARLFFSDKEQNYYIDNIQYGTHYQDSLNKWTEVGLGLVSRFYLKIFKRLYFTPIASVQYSFSGSSSSIVFYNPQWNEVWLGNGNMRNQHKVGLLFEPQIAFFINERFRIFAKFCNIGLSYSKTITVLYDGGSYLTAIPNRESITDSKLNFELGYTYASFALGLQCCL